MQSTGMFSSFFPTLWKYILKQYWKMLFLSLFGFLVILLSAKLEDAAKLTNLGAPLSAVLLFISYQVPYVLQIALPIGTLIASLYLFQRLSQNNELTAIRSAGISLRSIAAPIVATSIFLGLCSFEYIFDMSAQAHLAAKQLEFDLRKLNPIHILYNNNFLEKSGISIDMEGSLKNDSHAKNFLLVTNNSSTNQLMLVLSKTLNSNINTLSGKNLSFITTFKNTHSPKDTFVIENAKSHKIPLQNFSFVAKRKRWKTDSELLSLKMLLSKKEIFTNQQERLIPRTKSKGGIEKTIKKCTLELYRRASLSLAIITFTLVGIIFGTHITRKGNKKQILIATSLALMYLIAYLAARALNQHFSLSTLLFFIPHVLLIAICIVRFRNIQRGVAT